MRRILCAAVLFCILLGLTGCGSQGDENRVVIYTAAEEERIAYLQAELNRQFPSYEIVFQSLGTGPLVTRLQAEGTETECDIFYDLESANAELLLSSNSSLFYDLSQDYDLSIYTEEARPLHPYYAVDCKTDVTFVINKNVLEANGCPVPETYEDLLDPCYQGLISMPNPKSSGTGYAFYNGLVSKLGEEATLSYFAGLDKNISEYTSSGSAPIKALDRGEIAIGLAMVWQGVEYSNSNPDLEVVYLNDEVPYNLFTMGIINGKQEKTAVKEVFTFLYNELNPEEVVRFTPDRIYEDQGAPMIENYPTSLNEIQMNGQFDPKYKQGLLDKWVY